MEIPHVVVIALGGTILSGPLRKGGVAPNLSIRETAKQLPQLKKYAKISFIQFRMKPSPEISFSDLIDLKDLIQREFNQGRDAAVVVQGTDTIEETSFFLDVVLDSDKPVIVTGAMRNPSLPGADGPANLLSAVQIAASNKTHGLGTLVVMNDEIHLASFVQKTHTTSLASLRSPQTGPVGWVVENKVEVVLRPSVHPHIELKKEFPEKRVAIYKTSLGDDGSILDLILDRYDGLVVEGMGGGHVPSQVAEKIGRIVKKIPVVLSSRTNSGRVLESTYSHPGSEIDLIKKGLIPSGILTSLKARVLLYILLRAGYSREKIIETFKGWFS